VRREGVGDSEQGTKVEARQEAQDGNAREKRVGAGGENWGLPVQEPSQAELRERLIGGGEGGPRKDFERW